LPPRFRDRRYSDGVLPFGTFPDFVDCCHVSQQTDGRDLSSRFRDMMCPGPLVSRIREMPNLEKPMNSLIGTFPESFDSCHVSLKDGWLRLRRGFRWKETRSLVLRFPDFPNPDMPMGLCSSGLFRIVGFAPRVEDRWTVLMRPRDIATCDAPLTQCVCQVETLNVDSGLDVCHVSGQNGRL
jgi:hypothetical protein